MVYRCQLMDKRLEYDGWLRFNNFTTKRFMFNDLSIKLAKVSVKWKCNYQESQLHISSQTPHLMWCFLWISNCSIHLVQQKQKIRYEFTWLLWVMDHFFLYSESVILYFLDTYVCCTMKIKQPLDAPQTWCSPPPPPPHFFEYLAEASSICGMIYQTNKVAYIQSSNSRSLQLRQEKSTQMIQRCWQQTKKPK